MNCEAIKRLKPQSVGDWVKNNTNILLMLLLIVVGALTTENFFSAGNLFNVLRQVTINGMLAVACTMTLEQICADPEIELVINLTTPAAHYLIIKQCLLAGKHVWSEKMIAVELEQGRELVKIADEKGVHLGVAPDTFLGASVQTAKYLVDAGLIGEPLSCRASISRNYAIYGEFLTHLYKKGAGIGFDMGGYYLTALAAILGPAKSISAYTAVHNPTRVNTRVGAPQFGQEYTIEVPNVLTAAIQYQNGVLGTLHMLWRRPSVCPTSWMYHNI